MNRKELLNPLKRYEWMDVEFKESRNRAQRAAYETVSALANTADERPARAGLAGRTPRRSPAGRGRKLGQELLRPVVDRLRYRLTGHVEARRDANRQEQPRSDHVRDGHADMVADQVERTAATPAGRRQPLTELSATHRRIVERCEVPRRLAKLMNALGATNRGHFKKRHLDALIRAGIVTMTNPDNPRAPAQRYVLTAAGLALRAARTRKDQEDEGAE